MKTTTHTARLSGLLAIAAAKTHGATLCSYNDPTAEGREGLTADEARALARGDASLVYADVEISAEELRALATAAGAAGDEAQVELCDRAVEGAEDALNKCAEVIVDAANA